MSIPLAAVNTGAIARMARLFHDAARLDEYLMQKWETLVIFGLMSVIFLFAAFSFVDFAMALGACCAVVFAVGMLLPRMGLLLLMCCVPIQTVFDLPREQMQVFLAFALLTVAVRHVHLVPHFFKRRSGSIILVPVLLTMLTVVWLLAQIGQLQFTQYYSLSQEAVFFGSLVITAIAAYSYAESRGFRTGLIYSVSLVLAITTIFDTVKTYILGRHDVSAVSSALASLRLSGLHVNPNATAKYLVLAVMLAFALAISMPTLRARSTGVILFVIAALALSATLSKAALIGAGGALLIYSVYAATRREWRMSGLLIASTLLLVGTVVAWDSWLYPLARNATIQSFENITAASNLAPSPAPPSSFSTLSRLSRDFRLNESYEMRTRPARRAAQNSEMYRNIPGRITYTKRDCRWFCAGQRDRLWTAGFDVLKQHWLVGIGPQQWPRELQARLGFPFDSPHNALLELWGGYGILGFFLYGALVVQLLGLLRAAVRLTLSGGDRVLVVGSSLFLLAILITELFDPAKYLAVSPHTIWLWVITGALSRLIDLAHPQGSAPSSRTAAAGRL